MRALRLFLTVVAIFVVAVGQTFLPRIVNVQSGSYTLNAIDCNAIVIETGAQQTITVPAASLICNNGDTVWIKNASTSRAQVITGAGVPADLVSNTCGSGNFCLWPSQALALIDNNGVWATAVNPGRWRNPSGGTLVGTGGSDNNDCLTSSAPCASFQHAYDLVCNFMDTGQTQGSVSALAGIYTISAAPVVEAVSQCIGGNSINITGLGGSGSVTLDLTGVQPGGEGMFFAENGKMAVEGFTISNTGAQSNMVAFGVDDKATIDVGDIVFAGSFTGSSSVAFKANDAGLISFHGNVTFNDTVGGSGSAIGYPFFLSNRGSVITNGFGITYSGTAWTVVDGCLLDGLALLDMTGTTVTGLSKTTGTRWSVGNGGVTKGTSSGANCAGNANGSSPGFGVVN